MSPGGGGDGPVLTLRQHSALSAFRYDLLDAGGQTVGRVDWPMTTSTVRREDGRPGAVSAQLHGRRLRLEVAVLRRDWVSDRRLSLVADGGQVLASLELRHDAALRRPRIVLTVPVAGELRRQPGWCRWRYAVQLADGRQGQVGEPAWLSLRRTLRVDLPQADDSLRLLLGLAVLMRHTGLTNLRW